MTPASLIPLLISLTFLAKQIDGQLRWEKTSVSGDALPKARRDAGLAYDRKRNELVLFGGRSDDGIILNDVWFFNLKQKTWSQKTIIFKPPTPRHSFVYGISGDHFYVATGKGPDGVFYSDVWQLNLLHLFWRELPARNMPPYLSNQEWTTESENVLKPSARGGAAGGIFENKTHLFLSFGEGAKTSSEMFTYDVSQFSWYKDFDTGLPYTPAYPHARHQHSAAMVDEDSLIIYGGCLSGEGTGGPCPSGDSWLYDGKRKTWTQLPNCASPRAYSSMAMLPYTQGKRRVVLYGGQEGGKQVVTADLSPADEVAIFDPDTKTWTLRKTTGNEIPTKRMSSAIATASNGIYIFGGESVSGAQVLNDLWLLHGDASLADKAPYSGNNCKTYGKAFTNLILIHGILMVLGWGFFIQIGAIFARYLKTKNPLWFHLHRFCQVTGLLSAIVGVICAFFSVRGQHLQVIHGILGVIVMILGIIQPITSVMRPRSPKVGEIKSGNRAVWEVFHHITGRISLVLALITISLGLFMAVPHQLIWILWFSWVGFIVLLYIIFETYRQLSDRSKKVEKDLVKDNYYTNLMNEVYTISRQTSLSKTKSMRQVEAPDTDAIRDGMINGGFEAELPEFEANRSESVLELQQQQVTEFGDEVEQPLSDAGEDDDLTIGDESGYTPRRLNSIVEEELDRMDNVDASHETRGPEVIYEDIFQPDENFSTASGDDGVIFTHL